METLIKQIDPAKLRAARERAGLSQEDLGKYLNIKKAMVSQFERGYSVPDADQAAVWAEACYVADIDSLYSFVKPNAFRIRRKPIKTSPEKCLT